MPVKKKANSSGTLTTSGVSNSISGDPWQSDLNKLAEDLYGKLDSIDKKAEERQTNSIEALGVFVTLFSFISISVQVFSRVTNAQTAGLIIFLLFCLLSSFILILDIVLKSSNRKFSEKEKVDFKTKLNDFFISFLDKRIAILGILFICATASVLFFKGPLVKESDNPNFREEVKKIINEELNKSYSKEETDRQTRELEQKNRDFVQCVWKSGINNCLK